MSTVSPGQTFFSLPTQRCFRVARIELQLVSLFSAYAEVFPWSLSSAITRKTFLCLRRGVSWFCRWFSSFTLLFSAYAEVFPRQVVTTLPKISFLCLRRGVSKASCGLDAQYCFSLPTQRCFSGALKAFAEGSLFSAYAEVFLLKELN